MAGVGPAYAIGSICGSFVAGALILAIIGRIIDAARGKPEKQNANSNEYTTRGCYRLTDVAPPPMLTSRSRVSILASRLEARSHVSTRMPGLSRPNSDHVD
jgi:hypothetical protein